MTVPLSPSGTVKLSLMLMTRSNSRYSASGSGTTPCCCSNGYTQTDMYSLLNLFVDVQKSISPTNSGICVSPRYQQLKHQSWRQYTYVLTLNSRCGLTVTRTFLVLFFTWEWFKRKNEKVWTHETLRKEEWDASCGSELPSLSPQPPRSSPRWQCPAPADHMMSCRWSSLGDFLTMKWFQRLSQPFEMFTNKIKEELKGQKQGNTLSGCFHTWRDKSEPFGHMRSSARF